MVNLLCLQVGIHYLYLMNKKSESYISYFINFIWDKIDLA